MKLSYSGGVLPRPIIAPSDLLCREFVLPHNTDPKPLIRLSFATCFLVLSLVSSLHSRLVLIPMVLETCLLGDGFTSLTLRAWLVIGRKG